MRRVLLVYPEGDSPHALRIIRPLARHLPDLGWEPTLLTQTGTGAGLGLPRLEVGARQVAVTDRIKVPVVPPGLLQRARSAVGRHAVLPDRYLWWARAAAKRALNETPFDAVFSAGPPHSAHFVAAAYRRRHSVPWIADMRDAWTTNHYTAYNVMSRTIDRRIERRTLASASQITTVSAGIAKEVGAVHRREVLSVPNCFDEAELREMPPACFRPLELSYAGSLIGGRRDPTPLMRGIALLRAQDPDLSVRARFVTDHPDLVTAASSEANVQDVVDSRPWVSRDEVLEMWRKASVLVLLRWDDPREADVPTGKLFEYLGAGRPVLSIGGPAGVVGEILQQTGGGRHVENAAEAAAYLLSLARHGWTPPADLDQFSSATMASRFARLFEL